MDVNLEFEREMLLKIINENSLTIISKGIGSDRLVANLVKTYSTSCHLVLVIGAEIEEEDYIITQVNDGTLIERKDDLGDDPDFVKAKRITSESVAAGNRRDMYLSGGVIFITTRILVVDMLTERLPFESVSGIIVMNAHRVIKDCHLSFILRLFRMNNKTGFITAVSQNAPGFLGSFAQLERIMRCLFVSKLFLWPRFHATVNDSLMSRPIPNVIEMRIHMTPAMKQIQFALIDLISQCLKELTSMNSFIFSSSIELENKETENSLNTINVISKGLNKIIRAHLDSVWFQLSARARRIINDTRFLKSLLFHLTQLDAVSFYAELKHIQDSVPSQSNPSEWLFWPQYDLLYRVSKERVYRKTDSKEKPLYNIEINPKLEALNELLNDIEAEVNSRLRDNSKRAKFEDEEIEESEQPSLIDIIIVVESRYSIYHIETFRDKGKEVVMQELRTKCDMLINGKLKNVISQQEKELPNKISMMEDEDAMFDVQLTLTQMLGQYVCDEDENINRKHDRLHLHYFEWGADNNYSLRLKRLLTTIRPQYVILYEPEMCCIRQIEMYQALYCKDNIEPINVYYFIFDASAEEQRYLRNLQVEKDSFERLIEEKSKLVKVHDSEGLAGLHPDLIRGEQPLLHPEEMKSSVSSRAGGSRNAQVTNVRRQVLVDMREFRSQLPACVHKMNIELEPVTLEIGDYIITPDTCLERKSIADLIGSLNSGRLYYQTQMMTRYYKRPLLLIEFEDSKSFNFKARYWKSLQSNLKWSSRPNPLIQLAVLTIHFPLLRLIWSPSPLFSAFIIDQLKKDKDEPDKDNDVIRLSTLAENGLDLVTIGGKELPREYVTDRYDIEAKDFLLSLPGVTTGNVYSIMNRVESMLALVDLKIEELTEIMGSSQHAEQLYHALHCKLVDDDPEEHQTKANEKKRFVIKRKTNNKK